MPVRLSDLSGALTSALTSERQIEEGSQPTAAHTHGSGNQSHETHARQRTKRAFLKSSCGLPNLSAFCDLAARSLLRYPHECFAAAFFS